MSEALKACPHETLLCGSGDYYLFCTACHAKWMRADPHRAEYGTLPDGERVGAAPELCQPGFDMRAAWNRRTPPPVATVTREELVNLLYDYRDESRVQIADAILALLPKPT